jgi:hypothetical protein
VTMENSNSTPTDGTFIFHLYCPSLTITNIYLSQQDAMPPSQ